MVHVIGESVAKAEMAEEAEKAEKAEVAEKAEKKAGEVDRVVTNSFLQCHKLMSQILRMLCHKL